MVKQDFVTSLAIGSFVAFTIVIASSFLITSVFPEIDLIKGGPVFIIFAAMVVMSFGFKFVSTDRGFTRDNIIKFSLIVVIMIGTVSVVRLTLPEIFAFLPNPTQEVFSFTN